MPDAEIESKLRSGLILNRDPEMFPALAALIQRRLPSEAPLPDVVFDLLYKTRYRRITDVFWTPVEVVRQAMAWLPSGRSLRILDVGSGVGKFCLVGSLASRHELHGVEHRPRMVAEAERVAAFFPSISASFQAGDAFRQDWTLYNALYFFNPFAELNFPTRSATSNTSPQESQAVQSIALTRERLKALPAGMLVLTYYTFGSAMPPGFELLNARQFDSSHLELWRKL